MNIAHISEKKLKKDIKNVIFNYLDPDKYRAFFFGSRVRGDSFERADIDVGVEGEEPLDSKTKISIMEGLDRLPILYKIDFVDFGSVGSKFRVVANKHKEYID